MSVRGIILQLAYCLRRHLFLSWSLARWLGFLILATMVALLIWFWIPAWPAIAALGLLFLAYLSILWWANRTGYVYFVPLPALPPSPNGASPLVPVRTEEMVPIRASGWFTVQGKNKYYMDLDADYQTVPSREHIVLARVYPSRFLLLGQWPEEDLGWWYMFFLPSMIEHAQIGYLHFGARPRLSARLIYRPDSETKQTIYLTFDSVSTLKRVWADLLPDAPPGRVRSFT